MTRDAVDADVPEIVRVINLAYRVEDFFKVGDRTDAADIRSRMAEPNASFVVIDSDTGGLAGAVWMEIIGDRGHFGMLSVDPAQQGKGIARALIGGVEERCRAAGCRHVDIEVVNLREELPAFYTKLGFTEQGTKPFWPPEELTREAHMIIWSKPIA
jgi:ribosomal protein S18 acetylase RimI-like enzyme